MLSQAVAKHIELWRIDRLVAYARNPRTHSDIQISQIAESIAAFGFNNPILVDTHAGIIAGHGRLLAARKLELAEVPVIVLDHLTETQKRAYIIADNQLALNAGWDDELLRAEIASLQAEDVNVNLLGFDEEELLRLLNAQDCVTGLTDEDSVPSALDLPVTRSGDLWLLGTNHVAGTHRVLAGDATDPAQLSRLMNGSRASLCFSDPPYGCNLAATQNIPSRRRTDGGVIANDALDLNSLIVFLRKAFGNMLAATRPGAAWYITAPHGPIGLAFSITLHEIGVWRHSLVWVKDSLVMGRMDYHYRHEPIYFGWTPGAAHHPIPTRDQDTVWEIPRPKASPEHPSMKPVALMERAILNSSDANDIVLDAFGGSGSTIIACEKHCRRAHLLELEPKYVDVTVSRWQQFTGKHAVLDSDGRSFDEIAGERRKVAP